MIEIIVDMFLFWVFVFLFVGWSGAMDDRYKRREEERSRKFWAGRISKVE